eukprot:gnl/Chilomastix_cuspidata/3353.p1 GENE.gnl/Chilomastix_cuspidata/3353~~gnl/Chilomastix_cuspidata/3353.p1  ORF type:complete len:435 (+),score=57.79 gnl/Chilomastix_cuspidata/3353:428-1732(+)
MEYRRAARGVEAPAAEGVSPRGCNSYEKYPFALSRLSKVAPFATSRKVPASLARRLRPLQRALLPSAESLGSESPSDESKVVLYSPSYGTPQRPQKRLDVCPTCKRPFIRNEMDFGFFSQLYAAQLRPSERKLMLPSRPPSPTGATCEPATEACLDPSVVIPGYYGRFFEEREHLGSGSFGEVFRCVHQLNGIPIGSYAVKKVAVGDDPQWFQLAVHEVQLLERLRHPNIIAYRHCWVEPSAHSRFAPQVPFLFILLDFADRGSLDQELARAAPLTEPDVWHVLAGAATGLAHLHALGILHRDLKPGNVFLMSPECAEPPVYFGDLRVLIGDLAQCMRQDCLPREHSGGTGTAAYLAPEIALGEPNSYASDMYSLGLIAGECMGLNERSACAGTAYSAALTELQRALVARDPAKRPSARAVLAQIPHYTDNGAQ